MNHREPTPLPAIARRALRRLLLVIITALAPQAAHSRPWATLRTGQPGQRSGADSSPYLPTLGAPPLRFLAQALPENLPARPADAPASPGPRATSVRPAIANVAEPAPVVPLPADDAADAPPDPAAPPTVKSPPAAILPDDTQPAIRPEDFLPYFQIPGSARGPGGVKVIVPALPNAPAPASLPPSSATYTQTLR